jgi:hypothetical protein
MKASMLVGLAGAQAQRWEDRHHLSLQGRDPRSGGVDLPEADRPDSTDDVELANLVVPRFG